MLPKQSHPITGSEDDFDVLIDAGLGIGICGKLRPVWEKYVEFCNEFNGPVISVDVPTGFGTDTQVMPNLTVTMVDTKSGMNEKNCGEIIIADIGMPLEASLCTGPGDMLRYPIPKADCHKGDSGRLMIIGGGPYFGAPALASSAAMRVGTDLVYPAVPSRITGTVASLVPEAVITELPGDMLSREHSETILNHAKKMDAILIGPGIGCDPESLAVAKTIIESLDIPTVIDADAISAVPSIEKLPENTVITPHLGEFVRLGGKSRDAFEVRDIAAKLECTILLKGRTDIISDGNRVCTNFTGCAAMSSAGTGDILAGTVAGLLARGMIAFDAAKLGAWIVGTAGETVFEKKSYGLCATDLPDAISSVLAKYLNKNGH